MGDMRHDEDVLANLPFSVFLYPEVLSAFFFSLNLKQSEGERRGA